MCKHHIQVRKSIEFVIQCLDFEIINSVAVVVIM